MDELEEHIIADVSFKMTERHYPRPIGWNAQIGPGYVDGVDDSGYVVANGMLTLPEKPGFGMDLVD